MSGSVNLNLTPTTAERPPAKHEDSLAKTVAKKYAGGAASKAGGQTEEYLKDHHQELAADVTNEYDAAKARAQQELDDAKQVSAIRTSSDLR